FDISPECIHVNKAAFEKRGLHADFVVGNLFDAKCEQRFDIVMHTGLLEHFSIQGQADLLRIFSNSLKPGGVYMTYVPYAGGRLYRYCMERTMRIGNWKVGPEVPIETFREMEINGLELVEEYPLDALYQLAFLRGAFPILGTLTLPVVMIITRHPSVFEQLFFKLISGYGLFAEFKRIEGF
ncbi:MAG: class I SAM-dependent methyltransferase, partial [Thermoplasmata archaeon]|nr:class I SAM-dependent methyltransferase [Thermoplasmata archaeon]